MVQIHDPVDNGGGIGRSELFLNYPASAGTFKFLSNILSSRFDESSQNLKTQPSGRVAMSECLPRLYCALRTLIVVLRFVESQCTWAAGIRGPFFSPARSWTFF